MRLYSRILAFLLPAVVASLGWFVSIQAMSSPQQDSELFKQARALEDQQKFPAAEDVYRKVLASDPNNREALKRLGILQQTELKFDDSIESFKRVLAADPGYPQVNFFMGLSYYGKHDLSNTVSSFQRELKTSTAHPATRYYLALAYEGQSRPDDAIEQLQKVAVNNPNNPKVFYELARLHIAATFRAIDQLRRIDPDSFQYHAFMAEFGDQMGQYETSIREYKLALKKDPTAQGIHSRLGIAYWMVNQTDPAEKEFLLAIQEAPDDPYANLYLGRIAVLHHDFKKALPYLLHAVATRVEEDQSRVLLGRCYIGLGQLEDAKADLIIAAEVDPADPRPHYMLADIYQKLNQSGDRERELALYDKLQEVQRAKEARDPGTINKDEGGPPSRESNP